jgi:multiple sugar transport system permease protein
MSKTTKKRTKTVIGVILTAIMLFPVYWMINVSFTTDANLRKTPPNLIPVDGTLDGYRAVLSQQLPYLGNSLMIGLLTVALTLLIAAPPGMRWRNCVRAAAACSASRC